MIEAALGRLGAMKSELLPPDAVDELVSADGVDNAVSALEKTSFRPAAAAFKSNPSPAAFERELWAIVFASVVKLTKFLEGPMRECVRLMVAPFELDAVRLVVRGIMAGHEGPGGPEPIALPPEITTVDITRLYGAHTAAEVEERLANTPYAAIAERAFRRLEGASDLFAFEQVLERELQELTARAAAEIGGSSGRSARSYVEARCLYTALRWVFRLRFARKLSHEETLQFLPSRAGEARAVSASRSMAEAIEAAQPFVGRLPAGATLADVDRAIRVNFDLRARVELKKSFLQYASLLAYCDVRAAEARTVTAIFAAKRQGRSAVEIRHHLGQAA